MPSNPSYDAEIDVDIQPQCSQKKYAKVSKKRDDNHKSLRRDILKYLFSSKTRGFTLLSSERFPHLNHFLHKKQLKL